MDVTLLNTIGLLGVAILVAMLARRLSLPYTVGLVVTGIGLAVSRLETGALLTHDFIFDVILPPLLTHHRTVVTMNTTANDATTGSAFLNIHICLSPSPLERFGHNSERNAHCLDSFNW